MELNLIKKIRKTEKIHFLQGNEMISSFFNVVTVKLKNYKNSIELPITPFEKVLGRFRIFRRLLRYDMCNVFLAADNQLVIIRKGIVYNYDIVNEKLRQTLVLKQCSNVLSQSICKTPEGEIYFGEYGNNSDKEAVNIYRSNNNGKSWEIAYTFPKGKIRHVHGCFYDKYTCKIWILTGDLDGENLIQASDLKFENIQIIGDRTQKYRAVNLFFEKNKVHWIMDSPLEKSYQFVYDRNSKEVTQLDFFNGPVWYLKRLEDGYYLAGSSVEKGEGVLSNEACLYVSKDLVNWKIVESFKKDLLPMPYFKWGVLSFSEGIQDSKNFSIHFEGLKKVDGQAFFFSIIE